MCKEAQVSTVFIWLFDFVFGFTENVFASCLFVWRVASEEDRSVHVQMSRFDIEEVLR